MFLIPTFSKNLISDYASAYLHNHSVALIEILFIHTVYIYESGALKGYQTGIQNWNKKRSSSFLNMQLHVFETHCDGWWCWWAGFLRAHGYRSPAQCRTAPHSVGTVHAAGHSRPPEPDGWQNRKEGLNLCVWKFKKLNVFCQVCRFNLDKRKSGSGSEGFIFVLDLVSQVLLHSLLLEHLLLALGPKQDTGRDSYGHSVFRLWLQINQNTTWRLVLWMGK